MSTDVLMKSVDTYYESYRRVLVQQQSGKKEKPEKAMDRHHANHHDLVSASLLPSP
jgi:hypothetical protein